MTSSLHTIKTVKKQYRKTGATQKQKTGKQRTLKNQPEKGDLALEKPENWG